MPNVTVYFNCTVETDTDGSCPAVIVFVYIGDVQAPFNQTILADNSCVTNIALIAQFNDTEVICRGTYDEVPAYAHLYVAGKLNISPHALQLWIYNSNIS